MCRAPPSSSQGCLADLRFVWYRAPLPTSLFLSHNEALVPPYRIIVDTNFINLSLENRMDMVKSMMDALYAKCEFRSSFWARQEE